MRIRSTTLLVLCLMTIQVWQLSAQSSPSESRMMFQPAISKDKIAFIYGNDLWTANPDGSNSKRLTADEGIESNPFFSPDGKLIAFSAQYDGNVDVFIVPAEGGIPKRLTWHPMGDVSLGFTRDGKNVLFTSAMNSFTGRYSQFYTVPIEGGFPVSLNIPTGFKGSYSPDGTKLAYTPKREVYHQWKRYRGGTFGTIWICNLKDLAIEKIPQPAESCNDADPMWVGDNIYFNSDRNGEFNIFKFNTQTKEIKQITNYTDFPIKTCGIGDGKIIFDHAGYLNVLDLATEKVQKLTLNLNADLVTLRKKYIKGSDYVREFGISPSGARATFNIRGEIVTVPAEKGDVRNLTRTMESHERSPSWSPDGQKIAWFSDESGEYMLHVSQQDGKGETKEYKLMGAGFYDSPAWSPDNKKICYHDNSSSLYYIDLESGKCKKFSDYEAYNQAQNAAWAPDSKWITYTLVDKNWLQRVFIYSLDKDKTYPITDGMSDVFEPRFDISGKYLYFFGSTNAGPVRQWFDQSNADMKMTSNLYLTVLNKDSLSPLAKESDDEKPKAEETDKKKADADKDKDKADADKNKEVKTIIDLDGITNRIISIPVPEGNYSNLQTGKEGEIYYIESPFSDLGGSGAQPELFIYNLKKRKSESVLNVCNNYMISPDGSKILYQSGPTWVISNAGAKVDMSLGKLNMSAIDIQIDPQAEWKQIFNEVWRINRDYFYDPNFHGANWSEMKTRYEQFLPYLSCRADLNRLIQMLCSELVVGHSYSGGGDYFINKKGVPGGLLGADYQIKSNRYQFKKIYGGLNWTPSLRSPLTEPGVKVNEGDYLIKVNGQEITASDNIYAVFENTAGKICEITVSNNSNGKDSRTYPVTPIANEGSLRNRNWVESNIKKVHDATNGKVAYVWVPDTHIGGHESFKRYFFPQADKDAIIVDERFNGGGLVADYYIDILKRPYICSNSGRYGTDSKVPGASIQGPKVMLIDENAGSGGDLLPWMFRKFNMGTMIGKRTWGGLVGIGDYPVLMDGGFITSPNLGLWAETGWICENEGVAPDIDIEQLPQEVAQGKDPQLDKAIEVIMQQLEKNPPVQHIKPPFPVKVKK
jgi:tricorn protease